ncbi:SRPBCC family protein [Robiginitalea sediminis]|uniref:SRPBCC family protein n=1 Tax=Robiginitalea sediminis TaxID=1982593 RepID=UPI0029371957|nr:SRPBCC family protein [Robiginitalea sediminis]
MMTTLYVLAGILLLLLLLYVLAPSRYEVSRSIEINRQPAEVFQYLRLLKNQDAWSPWGKRDPDMKQEFRGTDGEVGAVSAWEGNKEVGSGEQEITRIEPGKRIETQLRFLKPWKSTSDAFIEVAPSGSGSEVRWGFAGKNGFPMRFFMLFMNMDKMVGKDFEEGLASLKEILEQEK